MRKPLFATLALGTVLALGSYGVAAQTGPHGGWGHHGGGHGMMAYNQLGLSDAQKASIKKIMQTNFAQTQTQFQALRQQRQAFEALTPTSPGYQAAATRLAQAEAAAAQARVLRQADIRAQVYAVLTPAQQAQLAAQKTERQARHQQWEQFKAQHPAGSSTSGK